MSARIVVALTAGFLVAAGIHMRYSDAFIAVNGPQMRSDFDHIWFGARAFWDGENPYALIGPGRAFEWAWPLRFPAPALIIASPLVFLPVAIARDAFAGISATVLAFGITRDGWFRLPLLMSAPCLYALIRGQWSPLLLASVYWAPASIVQIAKPTLGLACFAARPRITAALAAVLLLLLSFAVLPTWFHDWLMAIQGGTRVIPALQIAGGPVALLALLRWRRPEARLIAFTACVPQTFVHYEALYAFAVVRTRAQCLALALCSYLALVWGDSLAPPATLLEAIKHIGPLIIVFVYLPALWILLRQPNEGSVPAWVEQAVASCPQWIRGSVAPNSRLG